VLENFAIKLDSLPLDFLLVQYPPVTKEINELFYERCTAFIHVVGGI